jgi:hypothetical protein
MVRINSFMSTVYVESVSGVGVWTTTSGPLEWEIGFMIHRYGTISIRLSFILGIYDFPSASIRIHSLFTAAP